MEGAGEQQAGGQALAVALEASLQSWLEQLPPLRAASPGQPAPWTQPAAPQLVQMGWPSSHGAGLAAAAPLPGAQPGTASGAGPGAPPLLPLALGLPQGDAGPNSTFQLPWLAPGLPAAQAPQQQSDAAALIQSLLASAAAGQGLPQPAAASAAPSPAAGQPAALATSTATSGSSRGAGRLEEGQLPFSPRATPSVTAAMAATLPAGRAIRGARTPGGKLTAEGQQPGSWQTWVHYDGRQAFVGRLGRHSAAVAADIILAWQRHCLTAKVALKAAARELNLPAAGYEADAALMQQLRAIRSADQMKLFLQAIIPQEQAHQPPTPSERQRTRQQPRQAAQGPRPGGKRQRGQEQHRSAAQQAPAAAPQQQQQQQAIHPAPGPRAATPPRSDGRRKQRAPERSRPQAEEYLVPGHLAADGTDGASLTPSFQQAGSSGLTTAGAAGGRHDGADSVPLGTHKRARAGS